MRNSRKPASPYGLTLIESCFACVLREEGLFCRLPPETLRDLNSIRQTALYPRGALLFVEGESPRGLFILCAGQVKLSAGSRDGKSVTLRLVGPGEVLGLNSVIDNSPYPASAETLAPSQVGFVLQSEFLRFLRTHAEVSLRVAEHLSMELRKAWEQTRLLALAPSAAAKLAQLLLNWAENHGRAAREGVRVSLNMTQEEIGQTIGASRETVSRLLADFKRQRLISVRGHSVLILHTERLRALSAA